MHLTPHEVFNEDHTDAPPGYLGRIAPADPKAVAFVLAADEHAEDGRSQWMWVRLANGDLILGVFPQGEVYFGTETDLGRP